MTDTPDFQDVIGRTQVMEETILPQRIEAMAHALDLTDVPRQGDALPPAWHWLFFNVSKPRSELGRDGHPKLGDFLPNTGLPRRMWAGGRLTFHAPLPVGADARRESEIISVKAKTGKTGQLVFVTVKHLVSADDTLCIEEEHDIVYREDPAPDAPKPVPPQAPDDAEWTETFTPDSTLLFRYSALTYNGHRIHYDHPYATGVEGYDGLVVHGPLISTLLQQFAEQCAGAKLKHFSYRAMSTLFVQSPFDLCARRNDTGGMDVWATGPKGNLAMQGKAEFA